MTKNNSINILLIFLSLIFCYFFSVSMARSTNTTDFPSYYYAARTVLDNSVPVDDVFKIDLNNKYNIPEKRPGFLIYPYSLLSAYILAPLGLMDYYDAKTTMIFLNILMYLCANAIVLSLGNASGRSFVYPLMLSVFWIPFIHNIVFSNVNALMLFLVSIATFALTKNRPILCGTLLGTAALFKVFPLAIAMSLGLKNWRIFAASIAVVGGSLIIPGAMGWFKAMGHAHQGFYIPRSLWIENYGIFFFWCYSGAMALITALIIFIKKQLDWPLIVAFAIPAMFLTMPAFLYYHLTILMFTYAYLWSTNQSNKAVITLMILSILVISFSHRYNHSVMTIFSLFLLWIILAYKVVFFSAVSKNNSFR
ncbi:glycosyltransferase family 87 protein [Desulfuromonas sp. CSMB_57]|uniref:glycosyltransferase family 87 protein n=1 Tax=Desulfuromonas sp. CSMB_57 TaxID=2807629 RepID=UPI001CD1ECF1|nr:glycosyltransferase family 87 protein [Desulfuromonas sp. CSMB_57]